MEGWNPWNRRLEFHEQQSMGEMDVQDIEKYIIAEKII